MKTLFHKPLTVALLLAVFAVSILFSASPAQAKWVDRSEELPGTVDITPYLIAGGVLIGGIVAYQIFKPKSGDADDDPEDLSIPVEKKATEGDESAPSTDDDPDSVTEEATFSTLSADQDSRLGVFFNVKDDRALYGTKKPALDFSDLTVTAGITIGF